MANYENFTQLSAMWQAVIRRMVRQQGLPETEENLASEALSFRRANGWLPWEFDSSISHVRTRRHFIPGDPRMPAMPAKALDFEGM